MVEEKQQEQQEQASQKEEETKPEETTSQGTQEQAKPEEKTSDQRPKEEKTEEKPVPAEEKPAPEAEKKPETKEVEVPAKFQDLVKQIESLSVVDLAELVKILEEKFGVSAAAPVAPAAAGAGGGEAAGGAGEEKSEFNVELKDGGSSKIQVIKIVKEITGKGLKDAKDLVDGAPQVIKEKAPKAEAEEMKKKLEEAGATVELK